MIIQKPQTLYCSTILLHYMETLVQFFNYPMRPFGIRELGRMLHLNTKTIMKQLKVLRKQQVIVKVHKPGQFPYYEANRLSRRYKIVKSYTLMNTIAQSGLFDFLEQELKPKAIVVFGSVQKGTYLKNSDIDIFIQGKEKNIDLRTFEQKLGRDIQLIFEEDLNNLSEGLRNNIINGNTISGVLQP